MNYHHPSKGIQYAGGKGRCKELLSILNALLAPGDVYWEPFCGSCKIVQGVRPDARRFASDADPHVTALLLAVRRGWDPPAEVGEEEYKKWQRVAAEGKATPMTAFCGYGCSFGAKWFAGYARDARGGGTSKAKASRRALARQRPYLAGVEIWCEDYRRAYAGLKRRGVRPAVIYCDPPYAGTIPVGSVRRPFDSEKFWAWAVRRAGRAVVLVSEFSCPVPGAAVLWERALSGRGGLRSKSGVRKAEKLFCLNAGAGSRVGLGLFH
jgi:hypothetical protein